ncbi:hypothetical protein [Spirosoma arcticum]
MKTTGTYFLLVGWLVLAGQACGQDDRNKSRNDPTYSTHNYKHANKAAAARKWQGNSGVVVKQPTSGETDLANYKRQVPNQAPVGGVTVGHTPSTDVADRNYKMQRPIQSTTSSGTGVASRKRNRVDKGATVGD